MAELIFRGDSGVASATGGKTVMVETTDGKKVHIYAEGGQIVVGKSPPVDPEPAPAPEPEPQEHLEGEDDE